ncbi:hypothetical protein [Peptostreptococcus equinus]|uniref:DUF5009 domain-containing protein n=1 Tax=Peptostreptococcus equinus TaxID=3003601 RepID=A0ABY7JUX2_9FIRM|nr:hypothetical protein [Peptostreptococcus sp. CBA3647]WAW15517.1 hypothetical protein O0R46_03480 [Peptostreptococcus sp. CBA3647]
MANKDKIYEIYKEYIFRYREKRALDKEFSNTRIASIDFIRGILVIFSLIIINQGLENNISNTFKISQWNGITFADLIVPMLLITMGMSVPFFIKKYLRIYDSFSIIMEKIFIKFLFLFIIGIFINLIYYFNQGIRITGPLQLIAINYVIITFIYLGLVRLKIKNNNLGLLMVFMALIWSMIFTIIAYINGFNISNNTFVTVDRRLLSMFMTTSGINPEGILASFSSLSLSMLGVSIGCIFNKKHVSDKKYIKYIRNSSIKRNGFNRSSLWHDIKSWLNPRSIKAILSNYYRINDQVKKLVDLLILTILFLLFSNIISIWIPVNRNVFSISFITRIGSYMYFIMMVLYALFDIAKYRRIGRLIRRIGMNSILVTVLSIILYKLINLIHIKSIYTDTWLPLNNWICTDFIVPISGLYNASFLYSIIATLVCVGISWILIYKDIKINL